MGPTTSHQIHAPQARRRHVDGLRMATILAAGLVALLSSPSDGHAHQAADVPLDGGIFYLSHSDPEHGEELWRSDGTHEGTFLVRDIWPGPGSSRPAEITRVGATIYFVAEEPERAWEIWRTDGSAQGTSAVIDRDGGLRGQPSQLTRYGDGLAFIVWDGDDRRILWRSDGTAEGTIPLAEVDAYRLAPFGDAIVFAADDPMHGPELWRSDGTAVGTAMLKDIRPGRQGSGPDGYPHVELMTAGDTLYVAADDGVHGTELWRSDGTAEGTTLVKDIARGPKGSDPGDFTAVGETLYFVADDGEHGPELWSSDGTPEGTVLVAETRGGRRGMERGYGLVGAGDAVYFNADDREHGQELWRSDGTAEGTHVVKDIVPGPDSSYPWPLTAVGDDLYFKAYDDDHGEGLWRSDGTAGGTTRIEGLDPKGVEPELGLLGGTAGILYVRALSETSPELWRTDGTRDGTTLLRAAGATSVDESDPSDDERTSGLDTAEMASTIGPIVLEPVAAGQTKGPWRETARAGIGLPPGTYVGLHRVATLTGVAKRLVAVGSACSDSGCEDVAWHSDDGLTWRPAAFPGDVPVVIDVVRTKGRLVAGGYVGRRRWEAAIWSSRDGRTWRRSPAPPVSEVYDIAGSEASVVVTGSDDHLWVSTDLRDWRRLDRPIGVSVKHGPGGFLAYRGGGHDSWAETELWRSRDGLSWEKVPLTKGARRGNDGVSVHPLDDSWVLVTDQPGPIFTSRRGTRWRPAPRPPFMIHGASWVVSVGDLVQAQGPIENFEQGMWTWPLGEGAGDPRLRAGLGRPVRWQGGYVTLSGETEDGNLSVSLWKLDPSSLDERRATSTEQ